MCQRGEGEPNRVLCRSAGEPVKSTERGSLRSAARPRNKECVWRERVLVVAVSCWLLGDRKYRHSVVLSGVDEGWNGVTRAAELKADGSPKNSLHRSVG